MGIWLVMVAGMLVLGHAVVPHHHHHKIAVAIVHLHVHEHTLFAHTHHDASHSHNGEAEDCLINEVCAGAVLKVSVPEVEAPVLPLEGSQFTIHNLQFTISCPWLGVFTIDDPPPEERLVIPYIIHAYAARIARAVVLRAPTC